MGANQSTRLGVGNGNPDQVSDASSANRYRHAISQSQRSSSLQEVPDFTANENKIFRLRRQKSDTGHGTGSTLVVVKKPEVDEFFDINKDPVILRLKEIPIMDPIYRNQDKVHWSAEGERARSRIDPSPLLNIGLLLQTRTRANITVISKEQNKLSQKIKETDLKVKTIFQSYSRRQKTIGKQALQLDKITDFAHLLIKCQGMLNESKRLTSLLNDMLPENERLEPFQVEDDKELMEMEFNKPSTYQKDLATSDSSSSGMDFQD